MKIALIYVNVSYGDQSDRFAQRFVDSYEEYPPGAEHDTVIACNGGPVCQERHEVFARLPRCEVFARSNDGWDIGAYVDICRQRLGHHDLVVCLGESVHFHRAGWLDRFVRAWEQLGEGMYGAFASNTVRTHINTTGFVTAPKYLADYPYPVATRQQRYEFEHGQFALWRMIAVLGKPVMLVTWDGIWSPSRWREPDNILWRGDQSNCLMFCRHTDDYFRANDDLRRKWVALCDGPYR